MTTKQELLNALTAERFSGPVREYRATSRTAPIAELLDVLADEQAGIAELEVIRGTA